MRLRDHPSMRWIKRHNWPPLWSGLPAPEGRFPLGEEGVLREVRYSERLGLTPDHLALAIDHNGAIFYGALGFDDPDPVFPKKVLKFLERHIGEPVCEVGDAEVGSCFK
jgi:hypothetical protein